MTVKEIQSANEVSPTVSRQPIDVGVVAWVVALHQFSDAIEIQNAGVHDQVTSCSAVVADDDSVVFAKPALDVVERTFTAVGGLAEHLGVIRVNHVQSQQHQVFAVRAFSGH